MSTRRNLHSTFAPIFLDYFHMSTTTVSNWALERVTTDHQCLPASHEDEGTPSEGPRVCMVKDTIKSLKLMIYSVLSLIISNDGSIYFETYQSMEYRLEFPYTENLQNIEGNLNHC